jgi:protein SCO1
MKALFIVCFALMALSSGPAFGHVPEAATADIGLEEKLGQTIAIDAVFADENGNHVNLKDFIDKPTIIAPVYLGCMHECPLLLIGLAQGLARSI